MSALQLLLASFVTSLCTTFVRGFQQKNVQGDHAKLAFFTAYLIAAGEFTAITLVVHGPWWMILSIGTGGGLGVLAAMAFHKRVTRRK